MANVFGTNANLLVALAALLKEGSVTEAARKIGVSQSAMSGTLASLREMFDDPLLVRVGRSMQPTPRALALVEPLQRAIAALEEALGQPARFEPATSEARFAIAIDERAEILVVPELMRRLGREAPGVAIQSHAWGRHLAPPGLASGDLDLAIGVFVPGDSSADAWRKARRAWPSTPSDPMPQGHHKLPLFELGLATIVRGDHPRVGRKLDLDTYCALDHILVTEEPWAMGIIDDALARLRKHRRIAARVSRLLAVGWLVASTDLCTTIDERLARMHAQAHGLRVLVPPIIVPPASLTMLWHDRTDRDPARQWLREQVRAIAIGCGAATKPRRATAKR